MAMLTKFSLKHSDSREFEMWSMCPCANTKFLIEKSAPSFFSTSRHGMKLKLALKIPLDKWFIDGTPSAWSRDFVVKLVWSVIYTLGTWLKWDVIYWILLPRAVIGPSFNFTPFIEVEIPRGRTSPHLRTIFVKRALSTKA